AGEAAYAEGGFERAISTLTTFLRLYPESRYATEAERVRRLAIQGGPPAPAAAPPFDLGVVLPASGDTDYLAQALFNGIRLAVDEHNAARADRPVRLVFRDTGGEAEGAVEAVRLVVDAGADAIVGPLFSEEALAAADEAEAERVPLLAPLATDDGVARGRRYVFQANPTFGMRGRAMAGHAVRRLRHARFAVVAEGGSFGEVMGDAFADEVARLGGTVVTREALPDATGWRRLPELLGAGRLEGVEAVYLPVTGADAPEFAANALRGLEAMGLEGRIRPLGNTEWEGLDASRPRASRFGTVFTQDFHVDDAAAADFIARYRALSGIGADRLALIGYDVTRFLLAQLDGVAGPDDLAERLRSAGRYQGLAHRIDFGGGQVNRALFVMAYVDGEAVLVE